MPDRFPITVIILTLDEAENVGPCIECLDWADEVILLDSFSKDDTIERARAARPDVRVFTNRFEDFGQQRNWALDNTSPRHEWIFFVDADERITPACAEAIRTAVSNAGAYEGFFVCYRNIFLGRWIRHCKMFPTWQLRILRHRRVRYRKEGHGQREVMDGPAGYVNEPFDHLDLSKGLTQWIDRHNVYSSNEVELIRRLQGESLELRDLFRGPVNRRRCLKRLGAWLVGASPVAWFLYLYVFQLGFLDGRPGFIFCLLRLAQQIHIKAKLEEATLSATAAASAAPDVAAGESAITFHEQMARHWEGKYDKRSFWDRVHVLEECIDGLDLRGTRWLDCGCGTATLGRRLAKRGCSVVALDAAPTMLRIAAEEARREGLDSQMQFHLVDTIERMEYPAASFDGVLCNSVVEYLPDPTAALLRMSQALRDGGVMLVSVPNRSSLLRRWLCFIYSVTHSVTSRGVPRYLRFSRHEYERGEFARLLAGVGMEVRKSVYFGGPMPGALQRLRLMGPLCMYVAVARRPVPAEVARNEEVPVELPA